ncbi:hypothetical protein WICPIJ_005934 [Wickerhamomyces pijperi]|uniref:Uncharacterized protein n=1 Tax=Wickerhamomyces pijperi TaxID=599730 RepID=A0A9P8Q595_WICPI|nr:hypothetical protein WICPIJ_005934 [Wickerhamomyces pijperi]
MFEVWRFVHVLVFGGKFLQNRISFVEEFLTLNLSEFSDIEFLQPFLESEEGENLTFQHLNFGLVASKDFIDRSLGLEPDNNFNVLQRHRVNFDVAFIRHRREVRLDELAERSDEWQAGRFVKLSTTNVEGQDGHLFGVTLDLNNEPHSGNTMSVIEHHQSARFEVLMQDWIVVGFIDKLFVELFVSIDQLKHVLNVIHREAFIVLDGNRLSL